MGQQHRATRHCCSPSCPMAGEGHPPCCWSSSNTTLSWEKAGEQESCRGLAARLWHGENGKLQGSEACTGQAGGLTSWVWGQEHPQKGCVCIVCYVLHTLCCAPCLVHHVLCALCSLCTMPCVHHALCPTPCIPRALCAPCPIFTVPCAHHALYSPVPVFSSRSAAGCHRREPAHRARPRRSVRCFRLPPLGDSLGPWPHRASGCCSALGSLCL